MNKKMICVSVGEIDSGPLKLVKEQIEKAENNAVNAGVKNLGLVLRAWGEDNYSADIQGNRLETDEECIKREELEEIQKKQDGERVKNSRERELGAALKVLEREGYTYKKKLEHE